MAVGCAKLVGDAVAAAEDDGDFELSAGHVADVGGVVDDLVEADEGERPAHEFDDRAQAGHGRADAEAGEAGFADRRVDHAARAEFFEHAGRHLVGAVVLRDFLAHEEDVFVAVHLLGHSGTEGFSELDDWHRFSHCSVTTILSNPRRAESARERKDGS